MSLTTYVKTCTKIIGEISLDIIIEYFGNKTRLHSCLLSFCLFLFGFVASLCIFVSYREMMANMLTEVDYGHIIEIWRTYRGDRISTQGRCLFPEYSNEVFTNRPACESPCCGVCLHFALDPSASGCWRRMTIGMGEERSPLAMHWEKKVIQLTL